MGVKLGDILKDSRKIITTENLVGKTLAVDAFNWLYQFLAIIRGNDGSPLKDYKGRVTSHLSGLFYRNLNLMDAGIKLIYVFDGQPNPLKAQEIQRRREAREISQKKMEEAQDDSDRENTDIKRFAQGTSKLTKEMIEESKQLLSYMGIPYIVAPQDGEAQAAHLIQSGKAWGIASQDYDAFLFNGERVVRNLSDTKDKSIEYYHLPKTLENLNITQAQLVDMAILVGVDFFDGIAGIGDKTAYKLIKEYGTIEKIISQYVPTSKKDFSALTPEFLETVRNIFLKPQVTDDFTILRTPPNYEKIQELLVEEHNFNQERMEKTFTKMRGKALTKTQKVMDNFFLKKS